MIHSAKDLLFDWLCVSTKYEVDADNLSRFQQAIDSILSLRENETKEFWFDLVRLHFLLIDENHASSSRLTAILREYKPDFPVSKNRNILQTVATSLLAQKMDMNDESVCDLIALAIINSNFGLMDGPNLGDELLKRASSFYDHECERVRFLDNSKPISDSLTSVKPEAKFEDYDIESGNYNAPTYSSVASAFKQTQSNLESLAKDLGNIGLVASKNIKEVVKELNVAISDMEKRDNVLREELNVLWWLVGCYSDKFTSPLGDLALSDLPLAVAFELDKVTDDGPGLGRVDNIISRAISYHQGSRTKFTLDTVIEHFGESNPIAVNCQQLQLGLNDFCPFLFALKCKLDFPQDNEWKVIFKKRYPYLLVFELDSFIATKQIYRELQLRNLY